jgi:shikimate dehydrogenase
VSFPDAQTKLAGVVGHPVAHSLSPAIQNAALRHDGRNAVYLAFDVDPDAFVRFVDGMRAAGARGLNITLPHKAAAFTIATERSADAEATQAVNVLLFDGDRVEGHNTDVVGVRRALSELGVPEGVPALIIGAGGAGRAAARALAASSVEILITNRTGERAERLAERVGGKAVPWEEAGEAAATVELIVHATSMGLSGEDPLLNAAQIGAAAEASCKWLLDLVYTPGETQLVALAREAGMTAADGLSMLVHQGAEAYRLFWGADAPVDVMVNAAREATARAE